MISREDLTKTEKDMWVDVRRYEWRYKTEEFHQEVHKAIFNAVSDLGGFRIDGTYFGNIVGCGDTKTIYSVLPNTIGFEFSFNYGIYGSCVRTISIGKNKEKIKSIQDNLEKIIERHGYSKMHSHTAKPVDDVFGWLEKAYGDRTRLGVIF